MALLPVKSHWMIMQAQGPGRAGHKAQGQGRTMVEKLVCAPAPFQSPCMGLGLQTQTRICADARARKWGSAPRWRSVGMHANT